MLSRELLRYRMRSGKLTPLFIDAADASVHGFIDLVIEIYKQALHQRREDLEQELELALQATQFESKLANGILKIIEKDAHFDTRKNEEFRTARLSYLKTISALRRLQSAVQSNDGLSTCDNGLPQKNHIKIEEFESRLREGALLKLPLQIQNLIQENLFADLPSQDQLIGVPNLSAAQIINRYNIALVQGLMLYSKKIILQIFDQSLTNRRRLYSYMKFFGITAKQISFDSSRKPGAITLELEGPLSVLDSSKSYAFQLSCFFPAVLQLEDWSLELVGSLRREAQVFCLTLDSNVGLSSYFEHKVSYRPEEIAVFKDSFNALGSEWQVADCAELIQLENGDHCFPDFVFTRSVPGLSQGNQGLPMYLEVFHVWNKSVLLKRLAAPCRIHSESHRPGLLLLAFDKKLLKSKEVDCALKTKHALQTANELCPGSGVWLTFSQFLNPKAVLKMLIQP